MYKRLALAATLAIALAGASGAQEARKYEAVDTATVSAIDVEAGHITLDTDEGERRLLLEPETRVLRGTLPAKLEEIEVGDRVTVEARDEFGDDTSQLVVDRIVIVVDPTPAE